LHLVTSDCHASSAALPRLRLQRGHRWPRRVRRHGLGRPALWTNLQDETAQLLDWALDRFPNGPGPLEDGNDWQFELAASREWSADEGLSYNTSSRRFSSQPSEARAVRHTLALTLSGSVAFCEALRAAFPADDD
jgi:hypothetical protein